jgi:hypothetical protein
MSARSGRRLDLFNTVSQLRQLNPAGGVCLPQQVGDMGGHGLLTDHERVGDLGIGRSTDEVTENLVLSGGQSGKGQRCDRGLQARRQRHPGRFVPRPPVLSAPPLPVARRRARTHAVGHAALQLASVGRRPTRPQRPGARRTPPARATRPSRRGPQSSANARSTRRTFGRARPRLRTTPTSPTAG